jgi:trk system potassium uptake protein TrkH
MAVIGFLSLLTTGTFLLSLPAATVSGDIRLIDAFFTTVSAASVTGLATIDIGTSFTLFGQIIILLTVQIGGVGIMAFSTFFILMAGRKPGLLDGTTLKDSYTQSGEHHPVDILKNIIFFTFAIEGIGTLLLFLRFIQQYSPLKAFYFAIFHSVAAFCNAGFALFPDNLMSYRADWYVNLVLAFLIILGGIGFLVFFDLRRSFLSKRSTWVEMSLHSRLIIVTTASLLVVSTLAILWLERNNTMLNLPLNEKVLASFFEAVTARTAGFNTIDHSLMASETLFFIIILMFIGGGAGSCAGGVKISSVGVLLLTGISHLRGYERPQIFRRSISRSSIEKAFSAVLLSSIAVVFLSLLVAVVEEFNPAMPAGREKFLELMFESVSAFGTVGLSTGVTPKFTDTGKFLLCILMAIGKLGPLTLALAVSRRRTKKFYYSEENIMVG